MDKIKSIEDEVRAGGASRRWLRVRGAARAQPLTQPPRAVQMARTQKNKATSGHLGSLKARTVARRRSSLANA
jgi:hypothetical protein